MGQISLPSNLLDRIKRVEADIQRLWKSTGLASATIAAGGLTLLNNAFFKMLGASNNEIVYIGPDGLGNQVVRIRDAAGNIVFGSVSAGGASQRVAINPNPAGPARIEFYDDGNTTDRVSLSLNGGNFVQQREIQATNAINGGKVSFYSGNSVFGHQVAGADAYLQFTDDESIFLRGKWATSVAFSGHSALFVNSLGGGGASGPIILSASYGPTMIGTMRPVATRQGPAADCYWAVTSSSSTGVAISSSGGADNLYHLWIFRTA
ncbi:hypothetical protein AB0J55_17820 [Amycolatopsis sp. NPDC049688]|uniref:hypothetical protein n=1 Tax=Amycolatopsis sp. NPDC049688 TaxID=3154733 RepID=UPI00343006E6